MPAPFGELRINFAPWVVGHLLDRQDCEVDSGDPDSKQKEPYARGLFWTIDARLFKKGVALLVRRSEPD